jgi:rfaE bifunctional protein nucleotidyltransferase chain/domain
MGFVACFFTLLNGAFFVEFDFCFLVSAFFLCVFRMALLAALESVDLVVMFEEKTPVELIAKVKPDIYVKGGDYQIDDLAETALVKTWGGKAYAIPFIHDRSTTALVNKIRA